MHYLTYISQQILKSIFFHLQKRIKSRLIQMMQQKLESNSCLDKISKCFGYT